MIDTSSRLLRLLALLQSRRYWAGKELAERLEITARTVRRDVDRLRSLGYPVESSSGLAGGYQLAAGSNVPPLLLDDDEALAVSLGLRLAVTGAVTGMEESALRALAKLEQVMPARLRKQIRSLHAGMAPIATMEPRVPHERLAALATASRALEVVQFRYADHHGRSSKRDVEPHGLVFTGSRWYLLAWDRQREDWRTFRVDRIEDGPKSFSRFLPRRIPGGDPAAFVARSITVEPYPLKARVILHGTVSELRERIPVTVGKLTAIDASTCLLETGAHHMDVLAYHLGLLGVDFEIMEPPELVIAMKKITDRLVSTLSRHG